MHIHSICIIFRDLLDNKVFFQHPDLMRALYVHETVMQLMVNTLNKTQQQQQAAATADVSTDAKRRQSQPQVSAQEPAKVIRLKLRPVG